jgi:hypothetical protein
MEADSPKRKRRRFQFRLRTLMVVTAALAVLCWIASLTKGNWGAFYSVTFFGFFLLLIVRQSRFGSPGNGLGSTRPFIDSGRHHHSPRTQS